MVYAALAKLKKNSVSTTLSAGINDVVTTIPVTQLSVFHDKDGTLITKGIVIGYDDAVESYAEEITITGASGTSGTGNLTSATRGVKADGSIGVGLAWGSGTKIAVMFSTGIYEQICDNIAAHESGKAPLASPTFTGTVTMGAGVPAITISDYFTLYPMGASVPSTDTVNPPVDRYETTSNKINQVYGVFTDGGTETLQWSHVFPNDWNGDDATLGKIIAQFGWTALSGSGTVKWVLKGKIFPNDAALDTALAAIGNATDTLITAEDQHLSPATTAAVVSPIAAGGKKVVFEVSRDSANDTLNATALLLEVPIQFIRTLA